MWVSRDLITSITDAVLEQVMEWHNRPLDKLYPIVFLKQFKYYIICSHNLLND
jgi:hypothetical protein